MAVDRRWSVYVISALCMLSACGTQLGFNIWANSIKDKFMLTQTQGKTIRWYYGHRKLPKVFVSIFYTRKQFDSNDKGQTEKGMVLMFWFKDKTRQDKTIIWKNWTFEQMNFSTVHICTIIIFTADMWTCTKIKCWKEMGKKNILVYYMDIEALHSQKCYTLSQI